MNFISLYAPFSFPFTHTSVCCLIFLMQLISSLLLTHCLSYMLLLLKCTALSLSLPLPASLHNPQPNFLLYQEMKRSGCTEINHKNLAESLKSLGTKTTTNLYSRNNLFFLIFSYDVLLFCTLI